MVAYHFVYYRIKLDELLFVQLLNGLNTKGWKSLLFQSRITPLFLMGVRKLNEGAYQFISNGFRPNGQIHALTSDVIMKDGCIFFLRQYREPYIASRLEVGVISPREEENAALLQSLLNDMDALFKQLIDGRKRRHMDLKSRPYSEKVPPQPPGKYSPPVTDPATVAAALVLGQSNRFLLLRAIAEKQKKRTIDSSDLQPLLDAGLVSHNEKDHSPILTQLGHQLNTRSHWMTVWLSHLLLSKGVPAQSIYVGLTDDGEEVDMFLCFQQQIWVFELKAGDFEANKAYPFQYRKVKFRADRVIALATGKISLAAKKVFADMSREKERSPVLIEGLTHADSVLTQLLINARLEVVKKKQQVLSEELGIQLAPIFDHLFAQK